jgi:hypothetical protein
VKNIVKYLLIAAIGTFVAFGGSKPVPVVSQAGSSTTTHYYGQPFKFHSSTAFTPVTGETHNIGTTPYNAGRIAILAADITIWSVLIWMIVRMIEQKPLRFWQKK